MDEQQNHSRWMPREEGSDSIPENINENKNSDIQLEPDFDGQQKDNPMPEKSDEDEMPQKGIVNTISLIFSAVFSPLLVPTYACAIALWITKLSFISESTRLGVSLMVFGITAAVPMAIILFLMRAGKVSDPSINNRNERTLPYVLTGVCYLIAAFYLGFVALAPFWLVIFFAGAMVALLLSLLINRWWKISAHSTSIGGLCAMVFFIAFNHLAIVNMLPWIVGALLCAGIVGSARLYLQRHTPWQVYAGFSLGFICEFFLMLI